MFVTNNKGQQQGAWGRRESVRTTSGGGSKEDYSKEGDKGLPIPT